MSDKQIEKCYVWEDFFDIYIECLCVSCANLDGDECPKSNHNDCGECEPGKCNAIPNCNHFKYKPPKSIVKREDDK